VSPEPRRGNRAEVGRAVAELLRALGLEAASEPELAGTPERVAELYAEVLSGQDPGAVPELVTFPHAGGGDLVVVGDLPFHSLCVHHLVPFFGHAHVAYLPGKRLAGISAPARLLDHYARRLQLQERLTVQLADHLERLLEPRGVAVVIEARHLCMEMRGIRKPGRVETRVMRGELAQPPWLGALRLGGRGGEGS